MTGSNSSSTSDLVYLDPDSTLTESFASLASLKPVSNSILLDHCRLPKPKPSTKTVLITRYPSTPSISSLERPRLYRSVSSLAATEDGRGHALSFAPLPPGKPRRSNSITLGVAARASMIQSQGGGSSRPQPRYSGELRSVPPVDLSMLSTCIRSQALKSGISLAESFLPTFIHVRSPHSTINSAERKSRE